MEKEKTVVTFVNATEAKNRFGDMIRRTYLNAEHLIVKRDGIPVVAIVPIADYERLIASGEADAAVAQAIAHSSKQEMARRRLAALLDGVHQKTPVVPEEEGNRDVEKAIRAVRART